jgi:hypothetical protein
MARLHYLLCISLLLFTVSSCKKIQDDPATKEEGIYIQFTYYAGDTSVPWTDMTKMITVAKTGDVLRFNTFRFYVCNVKLQRANGTWWAMPDSYFLIDAQNTYSSTINIPHIPTDSFIAISYTMGVDSMHNIGGGAHPALQTYNGMYWDEDRGYVMLRANGYSAQSSDGTFSFDLGGFEGANSIITEKTVVLAKPTMIGNGNAPTLTLAANVAALWEHSPSVNTRKAISAEGPEAKTMATDFYNGITMKSFK